jgi:hypothetical protein
LCKFNPLKIDVIRDELWINSYQEMMDSWKMPLKKLFEAGMFCEEAFLKN